MLDSIRIMVRSIKEKMASAKRYSSMKKDIHYSKKDFKDGLLDYFIENGVTSLDYRFLWGKYNMMIVEKHTPTPTPPARTLKVVAELLKQEKYHAFCVDKESCPWSAAEDVPYIWVGYKLLGAA